MLTSGEAARIFKISRVEFDTAVRAGRAPTEDRRDSRGRRFWRIEKLLDFEFVPAGPQGFQPGNNEIKPKMADYGVPQYPAAARGNPRVGHFFGGRVAVVVAV